MNEIARSFLATYANGNEAEGSWKYAKALQQSQLDYSDASLHRLDLLLTAIRVRAKPSRQEMSQTQDGHNFCALIAFYVIEMVRRRTAAHVDWHDRASALRALPPGVELPDAPYMRLIAHFTDQAGLFWPLVWVEAQVDSEGQQEKAADYIAGVIAQLERVGPTVWWAGMQALGRIASWQMMMAADGGTVMPLMLDSTAPTTWVAIMAPDSREDIADVMQRGGRRLEQNPRGAVWQVLAYDGYVELEQGRFDAVMVLLQTYGPSPLQLKIAFPYSPAKDGRPFAILDPTLLESNVEGDKIMLLNSALERGIQSIQWAFGTTWDQLRVVQQA
jgi:hypothetical protein